MKKFILTISTTLLFIFYVIYQRETAPALPLAIKDSSTTSVLNQTPKTDNLSPAQTNTQSARGSDPAPTSTVAPAPKPQPKPQPLPTGQYKDGQYIGPSVNAYYGNVQVRAIISGGKITDVQFLDYPQDRNTSREINGQAMPLLTQEAVSAQSANVDIISGATDTSQAFVQSLAPALARAKN